MTTFPIDDTIATGTEVIVATSNTKWIFDGHKWERVPLVDSHSAQRPIEIGETSVEGIGRDFEHTFTIRKLNDLENNITKP